MSTKPVQTLDSVLGSLGARFDEEACTLFGNNISVVMNQVHAVPEADQRNHLETCRQLFEVGHESWLEALVELVHRYAEKLAQIAVCYPALVSNDPAKWITLQLKLLLTKHLRQELCLEILSQQARQRILAQTGPFTLVSGFTYKIACEIARLQGAALDVPLDSKPDQAHRYSRVGAWFRWVAENGPDLDRSESGFHEPWMAPAFIDDRLRKRMTNGLPDRLSVAQTERVIRRVETLFAHSFDNVLRQVEHEGRITIGTNGAVPFALASRMQKTVPSSPATQSSPDLHDKLGGTTHPDEASAKIVITSKIGSVAANLDKKSTPKELINFISSDDGWTTAQPGFSDVALLNTYTSTVQTLRTVKIVMGQNNGNITADALRVRFKDFRLYFDAGPNYWQQFADDFKPLATIQSKKRGQPCASMPTPEHVAVHFLAKTTGLAPGTITKKLSLSRPRKRKKTRKVTLSNFE